VVRKEVDAVRMVSTNRIKTGRRNSTSSQIQIRLL